MSTGSTDPLPLSPFSAQLRHTLSILLTPQLTWFLEVLSTYVLVLARVCRCALRTRPGIFTWGLGQDQPWPKMCEGRVQLFLNARLKHGPGSHRTKAACESSRAFYLDSVILKKKKILSLVVSPWRGLIPLRLRFGLVCGKWAEFLEWRREGKQ